MKVIMTVVGTLVVLAVAGLAVIFSGTVNISALNEEKGLTKWVLEEAKDHSVKHHAKGIEPPASLKDPTFAAKGFPRFAQMCAGCHGAPGQQRRRSTMNPPPPPLAAVIDEWTPAELFWITKNGIKMTGMPAFGPNNSDDELWSIVAFLQTLPDVTPDQYQAMKQVAMPPDTMRKAPPTAHVEERREDRKH